MTRNRHLATAASWGLLDQAIYSAGSLLLGVTAAGSASAERFGYFALAYLIAVFSIAISRAVSGQPMTILFAEVPQPQWAAATAQMLRFVAMLGALLGAISIGVGLILPDSSSTVFVALGAVIPLILLQDAYRYALFADGRRATAVVADLIWLVLQAAGTLALWLAGASSPATLLAAWGAGAGISACWVAVTIGVAPVNAVGERWRPTIGAIWRPLVVDAFLQELPRQASGWAVTGAAGTRAIGSLRGAEILYGPVTTTAGGIRLAFIPIASSDVRNRGGSANREGLAASAIVAGVAAVSFLVWSTIPDSIGTRVLGSTWESASTLITVLGISMILQGGGVGGQVRLLANAAASSVAKRRAIVAGIQAAASVIGAFVSGALGAITGLAIANAIGLVVWWLPLPGDRVSRPTSMI